MHLLNRWKENGALAYTERSLFMNMCVSCRRERHFTFWPPQFIFQRFYWFFILLHRFFQFFTWNKPSFSQYPPGESLVFRFALCLRCACFFNQFLLQIPTSRQQSMRNAYFPIAFLMTFLRTSPTFAIIFNAFSLTPLRFCNTLNAKYARAHVSCVVDLATVRPTTIMWERQWRVTLRRWH